VSIRAILVLAASAVLVLSGCAGGDEGRLTKAEYEERVRSVYAEVQEAFAGTNVAVEALAGRVGDAQDELREAADELEDTQPPQEVEAENAQIVVGMRAYAEDLDRLRNAAERGDERTIEDFNARIGRNESVEQIAEAAERMKFKGYDLGPIGEE
jgi:uncharacterized lipoprotein